MRAAVVTGPRTAAVREVPAPVPAPGEIRIHVEGCGVCASSIPLWQGRSWFSYPLEPGAPGHEVWGRTDDGRRVAALCQRGFAAIDIAPADTVVELPAALDDIPFPGEALACAVNIVRRAGVRPRQRVAIVGMGFIGTAVARLCERAGASVVEVRRETKIRGEFERVIEASGTQDGLDTASRLVATRGVLVVAGFHQDGARTVDLQSWNWRGIDVVNAHERDPRTYVDAMRTAVCLTATGELDAAALVTHRFALGDAAAAFSAAETRPPGFIKAVVCP